MATKIYGIGAAQNPDNVKETIYLDGLNIDKLRGIRDEHEEDSFFRRVGAITFAKKIYSEQDCENERQLRCWNHANVPFLYTEAELADDTDHPNAKSAAEFIKFCQNPNIPIDVGFSVDGGVLERQDSGGNITEDKDKGKNLTKTVAIDLALTVKPCNPKCKMWLENDLAKSDYAAQPPKRYLDALNKSQASTSIIESLSDEMKLLFRLDILKKSLYSMFAEFADVRCDKCGSGERFFKSDMPNICKKCGKSYSMTKLWKAINTQKD